MYKIGIATVCVTGGLMLAGCDTTSPMAGYTPSTNNILGFQSALKPSGTSVKTGDFTATPGVEIPTCRMAGKLDVTAGKPLELYVKEAMQAELFQAGVYDANSGVVISGRLDQLKVNTFGTGSWELGLQVTSSKDPVGYHVQAIRTFKSSYSAMSACQNATNAFAPTVQDLLGQVIANPGFGKLVGK
ncbi:MAG: hypothetical protein JNL41_12810 [Phenylobacterium sp.]|uniref:hypothetical protein n=1 Tax=Phenylobacterium sp. TaxID=1871053 RepID=UPI001A4E53FF|nr:hypothetical protein [Phenylobacterium sp.]MBL8555156.1 hypothetical protein [Phenylobacterium sp.]